MNNEQNINALQARVSELEKANRELKQAGAPPSPQSVPIRGRRSRTAVAVIVMLVAVLLAPVAVLGTWTRLQLVDTETFVGTFAPLAQDPAVQDFLIDEMVQGVEENADIDGVVDELLADLGTDLSPRGQAAVDSLVESAREGLRSAITGAAERVVRSPGFANVWESALRETHSRAIAVIQGDPTAALQLSEDGSLTLELGPLIEAVKSELVEQGAEFASKMPVIDRSIPLASADSLVLVRVGYQVADTAGLWLPWVCLALISVSVAVANNRRRAAGWAGVGLTVVFLLLAAAIGIGKGLFVATVSPSVMPAATARVIVDQLTMLISSTVTALMALSVIIAVGAWLYGSSRPAQALRTGAARGVTAFRAAADERGVGTGRFGTVVDRWRPAVILATLIGGVVVLMVNRPITLGGVFTTLIIVFIALLAIELLRRPHDGATSPVPAEQVGTPTKGTPHDD